MRLHAHVPVRTNICTSCAYTITPPHTHALTCSHTVLNSSRVNWTIFKFLLDEYFIVICMGLCLPNKCHFNLGSRFKLVDRSVLMLDLSSQCRDLQCCGVKSKSHDVLDCLFVCEYLNILLHSKIKLQGAGAPYVQRQWTCGVSAFLIYWAACWSIYLHMDQSFVTVMGSFDLSLNLHCLHCMHIWISGRCWYHYLLPSLKSWSGDFKLFLKVHANKTGTLSDLCYRCHTCVLLFSQGELNK